MQKLLETVLKLAGAELVKKFMAWLKKRRRDKEIDDAKDKCGKTGDCSDFNAIANDVRKPE